MDYGKIEYIGDLAIIGIFDIFMRRKSSLSRYGMNPENAGEYWKNLHVMLRTVRLKCGYSDGDIAKMLGICRSAYTYYELGKAAPDVVTLVALAKIYGFQPEDFLHPEEFTDLKTARRRAPRKVAVDPKSIGELSPEERRLIAEYRLMKNDAGAINSKK